MVPLSSGVDIANATFTAAVWSGTASMSVGTFANTPEGMAAFLTALPEHPLGAQAVATHLVPPPTGGDALMLAAPRLQQGRQVSMPTPQHVRDWAKHRGRRAFPSPRGSMQDGSAALGCISYPLPSDTPRTLNGKASTLCSERCFLALADSSDHEATPSREGQGGELWDNWQPRS